MWSSFTVPLFRRGFVAAGKSLGGRQLPPLLNIRGVLRILLEGNHVEQCSAQPYVDGKVDITMWPSLTTTVDPNTPGAMTRREFRNLPPARAKPRHSPDDGVPASVSLVPAGLVEAAGSEPTSLPQLGAGQRLTGTKLMGCT
jgi:hypothetical protein